MTKSEDMKEQKPPALPVYEARLRVPFHDLDPVRVVWHGNYMKYFEIARDGLFEKLGVDLYEFSIKRGYLFPVIRFSVKYVRPLFYQEEFICKAILVEAKHRLAVEFELRLLEGGTLCTKARCEQAACRLPDMELMLRIPGELRELLGQPFSSQ